MAAGEERLKVVLDAVDRTAAPLRAMNRRIEGMLAPVRKVRNAFRNLASEAGLPKLGAALSSVGKQLARVAVVGVGAAAGVFEFVRRSAEAADALGDMTAGIGIGVEQFQEIQHAALIAGVSTEGFSKGVQKLAKNVGDLKGGTGALKTLLDKVAPSLAVQLKGATDTGEALEIMLSALRRLDDPLKRNALAVAAFGRSGQELARITSVSAEKFAELRQEARDQGGAFSEDAVAVAGDVTDALDRLKFVVAGLGRTIAAQLFPFVRENVDKLREWIAANRELAIERVTAGVQQFAEVARQLFVAFTEGVPKVLAFVESIGGIRTIAIAAGVVFAATLLPAIAAVVSIVATIGPAAIATAAAFTAAFVGIGTLVAAVARKVSENWDSIVATIRRGVNFLPAPIRRALGLESFAAGPALELPAGGGVLAQESAAAASAVGGRFDLSGVIDLRVDQRGARITGAESTIPTVGFGILPRGPALAPN